MNYLDEEYGNPSSIHRSGLVARGSIEMARERIANVLNCSSDELIFTGSGTEGNNTAIRGALKAKGDGTFVVSSPIEHSSIVNTCKALAEEGVDVRNIDVDETGLYDLEQLREVVKRKGAVVSLSYINNEIGTIQDMKTISGITKKAGALLHIDAVQALPYRDIDLEKLGADLVTFSGHKIYAPKGVGILYIKQGTPFSPMILGGEQEFGLRSGTENVAYIVGLSKAIAMNKKEKGSYIKKLTRMRDRIIKKVLSKVPDVILTGHPVKRSPNSASFCFRNINGRMLVKQLAWDGIECSSGSACSSPKNKPSHVLEACGIASDYIRGSLRVTLGLYNTKKDVDHFLKTLPKVVERMRTEKINFNNDPIFITQADFQKKLDNREDFQILDVRHVDYPRHRFKGSINIPIWRLKQSLSKLDKDKETVVVCYQGDVISPEVQQMLIKKGFRNVKVLKGGIFSYVGHAPP